jgi:hypothetical protein
MILYLRYKKSKYKKSKYKNKVFCLLFFYDYSYI